MSSALRLCYRQSAAPVLALCAGRASRILTAVLYRGLCWVLTDCWCRAAQRRACSCKARSVVLRRREMEIISALRHACPVPARKSTCDGAWSELWQCARRTTLSTRSGCCKALQTGSTPQNWLVSSTWRCSGATRQVPRIRHILLPLAAHKQGCAAHSLYLAVLAPHRCSTAVQMQQAAAGARWGGEASTQCP
jgi:hypothetical protein